MLVLSEDGYDQDEIAEIIGDGATRRTVEGLLHRHRQKIAACAGRKEMAMMDRDGEPRNGEMVETVARLIEQSSFGTVGARQLRDRTSSVSRDRALLQAYFSATAEGRAWWHAHRNDPDALYDAGKLLRRR